MIIDGLMCTQEYGSNKAEVQYLQKDVNQNKGAKLNSSDLKSDPAHRIQSVGPTWIDPQLFIFVFLMLYCFAFVIRFIPQGE